MKAVEKENVRVSKELLNQVREYVKTSGHMVGGFYDAAVMEKLKRDKKKSK